jgi:hypothetical protein
MLNSTHRCLCRQLPCLYVFPQCSHFKSPAEAFSFFDKCVPSLARRASDLVLSEFWNAASGGPSSSALSLNPAFPPLSTWCGRLRGMGAAMSFREPRAALEAGVRCRIEADPSATAISTAAVKVGLGPKLELFRRFTRCVPDAEPRETLCECVRRLGKPLAAGGPTESRC